MPDHDLLAAYALDAVDDVERRAVAQHLVECPACRAEVDGFRESLALLGAAAAVAPPASLRPAVLQRVAAESQLPPVAPRRGRESRRMLGAVAAVVLLAVLAGGVLVESLQGGEGAPDEVAGRLERDGGAVTLVVDGLDPAPSGHVHAVWVLDESGATLAGQLVDGEAPLDELTDGGSVAVSLERAPVGTAPRGDVLLRVGA